jgi:hypothetical protein
MNIISITTLLIVIIIEFITIILVNKTKLHNNWKILTIVSTIAIIIFIYFFILGLFKKETKVEDKDFLNKNIMKIPYTNKEYSIWPISHFTLYCMLGYYYPKEYKLVIGMGVFWEVMENMAGQAEKTFRINKDLGKINPDLQYSGQWWAGNYTDLIFNAAGFCTGVLINKIYKNTPKQSEISSIIDPLPDIKTFNSNINGYTKIDTPYLVQLNKNKISDINSIKI